jgi:hypothetical protein
MHYSLISGPSSLDHEKVEPKLNIELSSDGNCRSYERVSSGAGACQVVRDE